VETNDNLTVKYKIQLHCYKYNPKIGKCEEAGYWSDYPQIYANKEDAEIDMRDFIKNDGIFPEEIRITPTTI